jgi:hypothetical protein
MKITILFFLACAVAMTGFAQQRVGIGNTNPATPLDVTGTIKGDSVGVGMLPTQRLEVAGNVQIPAGNNFQYATAKSKSIIISPLSFVKGGTASGISQYDINGVEVFLDGTPAASIAIM